MRATAIALMMMFAVGCLAQTDTASTAQSVRCNGTCPIEEDSGGPSEADVLAATHRVADDYMVTHYPGAVQMATKSYCASLGDGGWSCGIRIVLLFRIEIDAGCTLPPGAETPHCGITVDPNPGCDDTNPCGPDED